jgi:hypothetical protein
MNDSYYDSSAVDNYIKELSNRETVKTSALRSKVFRRNAPMIALKYLGIGMMILLIGFGIKQALSFERTNISQVIHENINDQKGDHTKASSESDEVIDIELLLKESEIERNLKKINDSMQSGALEENVETVRDFYVYDMISTDLGKIDEVIIGYLFSSPGSVADYVFCYISVPGENGLSKRFDLVTDGEEFGRIEPELNEEIALSMNVKLKNLKKAKTKCGI